MEYIRWFQEIHAGDVDVVGGKGANLGEMTQAGLPVPPGFCITAKAYHDFVNSTGLNQSILEILSSIDKGDPNAVEVATGEIRSLINSQVIPDGLASQIVESYWLLRKEMGVPGSSPVRVAVRSSATAEDLPSASFAGQQDTYLNVCGEEALLEHVKSCWASLWTARATTYRDKQRFDHSKVYLAVVVQAMVASEVSGILFTANPVDGARDVAVINASWGLGEAIVSGLVTPDTLSVHKKRGEIMSRCISSKNNTISYAENGGIVQLETQAEKREAPALNDQQAIELVGLGCKIERHYGSPQDIEWAFANGRWYILQVRPITTLAEERPAPPSYGEYYRSMFVEIFPDPLTPIFASAVQMLFKSMLDFTFRTWGFEPSQDLPAIGLFYNQPYFNRDYIEAAFEPLSPEVRALLVAQVVNPFADHKGGSQFEASRPYLRMAYRTVRFMLDYPKILPDLLERYHKEVAEVEGKNEKELSDRDLVAAIRDMVYGPTRMLIDYDFLLITVVKRVYHLAGQMLEPFFGEEAEVLRGKLISGITGNKTMETNMHLWDLAQAAKASPVVSELLRKQDGSKDLMERLDETREGRVFLEKLNGFLDAFGHREVRLDILYPTWCEDPTPVFNFLRSYLDIGPNQDPHLQQERLIQQRQELTETVRARLRKDPKGRFLVWPLFYWLLDKIEFHTRERDTMHFEMTRIFPPFRRFLFELGARWTRRGILTQPEQIFFLSLDELREVADSPKPVSEVASQRQEMFEINKKRPCPVAITSNKEIYADMEEKAGEETGRLDGIAGSPGIVTGRARVIAGPEEFHLLQKGEILVAPITNPVWTPLFAIASGVITEIGGILSHGAIVAREYGIPAVMSISRATERVQDGQTVVVDGNRGYVFL